MKREFVFLMSFELGKEFAGNEFIMYDAGKPPAKYIVRRYEMLLRGVEMGVCDRIRVMAKPKDDTVSHQEMVNAERMQKNGWLRVVNEETGRFLDSLPMSTRETLALRAKTKVAYIRRQSQ